MEKHKTPGPVLANIGKHQFINFLLLLVALVLVGTYLWHSLSSQTHEQPSGHITPPSISQQTQVEKTPPVAITPEEKSIVAQKQQLTELSQQGDGYLNRLNESEKQIYLKGLEAQDALSKLKAQAEALNTQE